MSKGEVVVTHGVRVGRDARVSQERGAQGRGAQQVHNDPRISQGPADLLAGFSGCRQTQRYTAID
jgi:hypothetical protein